MFARGVTSDAYGSVCSHILPEVLGCTQIGGGLRVHVIDTVETEVLGHLRVGVLAIEESGVEALHPVQHLTVAVAFGGGKIFRIAKEGVGIGQAFVHSSMFPSEQLVELVL